MKPGGMFLLAPILSEQTYTRELFSEEQIEIGAALREFVEGKILARRSAIEARDFDLLKSIFGELGELGFLSVDIPESYGGMDLDRITSMLVAETISFGHSGSFAASFGAHSGIGTLPIVFFGNEDQKKKYLPQLGSGELISCYALTEPGSGSDALAAKTRATLSEDGGHYILNGTKQFITNGGFADLIIAFAQVDGEKFTAFIIDRQTPGISTGPEEEKIGLHGSSTTSITFENVAVPVENVLGEIGKGHEIAFNTLNVGRLKLGVQDLGGSKVCVNESIKYALERRQFGQPIAFFGAIKKKVADMIVRTYALDSMAYRTVGHIQDDVALLKKEAPDYHQRVAEVLENHAIEASMAKIYGSESLGIVSDTALQLFGGYGYSEEYPIASAYRDTRVDRIFEGTNEINRQIITGYYIKRALMEELPVREAIKKLRKIMQDGVPAFESPILSAELTALEAGKAIGLHVLNEAICRYGQDIRTHQQVGEVLADILTDLYVLDSTLSRIVQSGDARYKDVVIAIGRIQAAETSRMIQSWAREALCGMLSGSGLRRALDDLDKLTPYLALTTDTFELKRQVADHGYEMGRYAF